MEVAFSYRIILGLPLKCITDVPKGAEEEEEKEEGRAFIVRDCTCILIVCVEG